MGCRQDLTAFDYRSQWLVPEIWRTIQKLEITLGFSLATVGLLCHENWNFECVFTEYVNSEWADKKRQCPQVR